MRRRGPVPYYCFAIAAFFAFSSHAEAGKSLKAVLGARSARQLSRILASDARLRHVRLVCDVQLATAKIPSACFEVLIREKGGDLLADESVVSETRWLTSLCESRASSSRDTADLRRTHGGAHVPEVCRRAARERLDDLNYSAERDSPVRLFSRRQSKAGSEIE